MLSQLAESQLGAGSAALFTLRYVLTALNQNETLNKLCSQQMNHKNSVFCLIQYKDTRCWTCYCFFLSHSKVTGHAHYSLMPFPAASLCRLMHLAHLFLYSIITFLQPSLM